jgi:hypothetical protein
MMREQVSVAFLLAVTSVCSVEWLKDAWTQAQEDSHTIQPLSGLSYPQIQNLQGVDCEDWSWGYSTDV